MPNGNSIFLVTEIQRTFSIPYDPSTAVKDFLVTATRSIDSTETAKNYKESSNRRIFQGYHHASAEAELVFDRWVKSHRVFDTIRRRGKDEMVFVVFVQDGKEMFEVQVVETEWDCGNEAAVESAV